MTHSDVPGAFTVGFVVTGESFTGHDARVCDQVASTVEGGPERVSHNHQSTAVTHLTWHPAPGENAAILRILKQSPRTHIHTFTYTLKTTVAQSVSVLRVWGGSQWTLLVCVFSNQTRKTIQYMCCELSPRTDWTTRRLSADVTFKRCTPALSHSDKHRSKQGQPSPGPRLVNLDVDCSGISVFESMAQFLLFLCLFFRWKGPKFLSFFILRTACPL